MDEILKRIDVVRQLGGKASLTQKYPNEFEYYMVALELCDSNMTTENYFIFPVMPNSITISKPKTPNIKITQGGITVLKNPHFIPEDISLTGNFGRKFKMLLGRNYQDIVQSFKTKEGRIGDKSLLSGALQIFDERTKSGYGCCKILEDIIDQSLNLDSSGKQRHLIFYNLAFGNSFFVEPMNLSFSQAAESNMIWAYQLSLKAIAPVDKYLSRGTDSRRSNEQLVMDNIFQKKIDGVISDISSFINKKTKF